jgi:superfamily II DNA or RNA helicase
VGVFASKIRAKGKDIEEIDVAINAAGLHSTTNVIQKLGRATRLSRTTEKTEAIYVDFDDSCISPIGRKQARKRLDIYENKLNLPVEHVK